MQHPDEFPETLYVVVRPYRSRYDHSDFPGTALTAGGYLDSLLPCSDRPEEVAIYKLEKITKYKKSSETKVTITEVPEKT